MKYLGILNGDLLSRLIIGRICLVLRLICCLINKLILSYGFLISHWIDLLWALFSILRFWIKFTFPLFKRIIFIILIVTNKGSFNRGIILFLWMYRNLVLVFITISFVLFECLLDGINVFIKFSYSSRSCLRTFPMNRFHLILMLWFRFRLLLNGISLISIFLDGILVI